MTRVFSVVYARRNRRHVPVNPRVVPSHILRPGRDYNRREDCVLG